MYCELSFLEYSDSIVKTSGAPKIEDYRYDKKVTYPLGEEKKQVHNQVYTNTYLLRQNPPVCVNPLG